MLAVLILSLAVGLLSAGSCVIYRKDPVLVKFFGVVWLGLVLLVMLLVAFSVKP